MMTGGGAILFVGESLDELGVEVMEEEGEPERDKVVVA